LVAFFAFPFLPSGSGTSFLPISVGIGLSIRHKHLFCFAILPNHPFSSSLFIYLFIVLLALWQKIYNFLVYKKFPLALEEGIDGGEGIMGFLV
jgi:hypothetical protein